MKQTLKNIVGGAVLGLSTLAGNAESESPQDTGEAARGRITYLSNGDIDLGLATGKKGTLSQFGELYKLRISPEGADRSETNYIFGGKFNLGESVNHLSIDSKTNGIGLESYLSQNWGGVHLAADRISDAYHIGGGLDFDLLEGEREPSKTTIGIGVDYVNREMGRETLGTVVNLKHQFDKNTRAGIAYKHFEGGEVNNSLSGFFAKKGLGRTWFKTTELDNGNRTTFGELIIGENFNRPYSDFSVNRTSAGGDLHNEGLVTSLQGVQYSEFNDSYDLSDGGFVLTLNGFSSQKDGKSTTSIGGNLAYVFESGDWRVVPRVLLEDIGRESKVGFGVDSSIPFLGGKLETNIQYIDGEVSGRAGISFDF